MDGLVGAGVMIGAIGILAMAVFAVLLALVLHWICKSWSARHLATISSAVCPLGVLLLAFLVMADSFTSDDRISGPDAQGLLIVLVAAVLMVGPGWLLGRWAVISTFKEAPTE